MKFCKKQKLLFIHVPKCAGTSIGECFDMEGGPAHATAVATKNKEPETWNTYLKFTTVRNPWEVEVSSFFYKMSKTVAEAHPNTHVKASINGFAGFLRNGGVAPMMNFLVNENNEIIVDEVLKVENLKQDIDNMCKKYNLKLFKKLEKTNSVPHLNYKEYYTEQWMIDFIKQKHKNYIEKFNYIF